MDLGALGCDRAQRLSGGLWSTTGLPTSASSSTRSRRVAAGGTEFDRELVSGLLNASRHARVLAALTGRERDVLALIAEGRSNSAIAGHLVVSERAVEKHISNIFSKLGLPPSDSDHRRVLAVLAYLGS